MISPISVKAVRLGNIMIKVGSLSVKAVRLANTTIKVDSLIAKIVQVIKYQLQERVAVGVSQVTRVG